MKVSEFFEALAEGEVIPFKKRGDKEPSKSREVAKRESEITPVTRVVKEKDVRAALSGAERQLDHEARYKQFDVDMGDKTVYWVTQETYEKESKKAAKTLAKILSDADITGWTVKVVVRDENRGRDESPWQTAKS